MPQQQRAFYTRKRLLSRVKSRVLDLLGPQSPELRRYAQEYSREFRGLWVHASRRELLAKVHKSQLVLGADFHACSQSQRTHLRILRELHPKRPVILAMECFEARHQQYLQAYLSGKLSEKAFLKKIAWRERWGFPWENYRPLLELARERGFEVVGINHYFASRGKRSLQTRDRRAAQVLAALAQTSPEALIYVIFGDLHLAQSHLPAALRRISPQVRPLILFQNPEELYFRPHKGRRDVLRRSNQIYCLLESPPWVKWQNYLILLEQNFDRELGDQGSDFTDVVDSMVEVLCADFQLRISKGELAVFSSWEENHERMLKHRSTLQERQLVDALIEEDRSFSLPNLGIYYLSRASVNHAAGLAGQYIHAQLSGPKRPLLDMPTDLEKWIWIEAVGFFFSKWFNHRRKAARLQDLQARPALPRQREALALALQQRLLDMHRLRGQKARKVVRRRFRKSSYLEAARILGHLLGERIFEMLRDRQLQRRQLVQWLKQPIDHGNFSEFYLSVLQMTGYPA